MQIIIISGLAGAGKSTALRILEDSGYYCIDNLPPPLLLQLIETYSFASNTKKFAISVDTRSLILLRQLPLALQQLSKLGIEVKIIFLDAKNDSLIKRFSETRRKHPLSTENNTLKECILEERQELNIIRNIAHIIDTSDLNPTQLKTIIKQFVNIDQSQLNIVIQSFGYKYGMPIDSDFVFDVRCLPNPYYDPNIRNFSGLDKPIIDYLSKIDKVKDMINDIYQYIIKWLKEYESENRSYLTIAIGCTGGKHRSVYISEELTKLIAKHGFKTIVRHRQLNNEIL